MLMLGSLLLVWLLMLEARRPENWLWLTGTSQVAANTPHPTSPNPQAVSNPQKMPNPQKMAATDDSLPHTEWLRTTISDGNSPDRWDWSAIRDDRPFNASETDLFLNVLTWWRGLDPPSSPQELGPSVGCLQLMRQSEEYRGQLVRVSGTVRRAHRLTAHPNAQGIPGYWRCWLFPDGSDSPIVVYALDMPPSFPQGMAIREAAQFQGVFFKRWAYHAQGGTMTAPLVVARTADWQPAVPPPPTRLPTGTQTVLATAAVALLAAYLAVRVYRTSHRMSPTALRARAGMPDAAPQYADPHQPTQSTQVTQPTERP